ncbi:NDR1/HIN1-like protein 13 [Bidens hawaiensis]|uniref:NDR1/HIN1-like protein 13 n=1 Tax=Bidens hawaiensis TaxID=980011 RepID=UPI0040491E68
MTDRVYPSSKPKDNTNTNTKTTTATPNRRLPPPPNKTTPTTTSRHPYRPNPTTTRRRNRRGCACLCCFWSILIILLLLLITAIAGCIFYLLYHPHRPSFSIAAFKISELNLTTTASDDTTHLTSKLNLTLSIRNPNKKITFYYNSIAVMCSSHGNTIIAKGTYPNPLTSKPNNITIIHTPLHTTSLLLEPETANKFRSDLKKKSGLPLTLVVDTEARVKVESLKTKKVGIRIKCGGIHSLIPKGGDRNSSVAADVDEAKCKLDLRIKIWKWTF